MSVRGHFCLTVYLFEVYQRSLTSLDDFHIYNIMSEEFMSSKVDWGFKLSIWAHLERTAVNKLHSDCGMGAVVKHAPVCIPLDYVCLQESLRQEESSLYLIEVSQVNVLNLVHTFFLWLSDVKSSPPLTQSSPSGMTPSQSWQSMKWGWIGCSRQGTFSSAKVTYGFPFRSKQCHKPFVSLFCSLFCSINPLGRLTWKVNNLKMEEA